MYIYIHINRYIYIYIYIYTDIMSVCGYVYTYICIYMHHIYRNLDNRTRSCIYSLLHLRIARSLLVAC